MRPWSSGRFSSGMFLHMMAGQRKWADHHGTLLSISKPLRSIFFCILTKMWWHPAPIVVFQHHSSIYWFCFTLISIVFFFGGAAAGGWCQQQQDKALITDFMQTCAAPITSRHSDAFRARQLTQVEAETGDNRVTVCRGWRIHLWWWLAELPMAQLMTSLPNQPTVPF